MRNNRNYLGIWTNIAQWSKIWQECCFGIYYCCLQWQRWFFLEYFFYWIVGGLVQLVPDYPHDGIQKYQKKAWYCEFQVSGKIPIIECIFKNPSNRWIRNILLHNSPNIRVLMRDARPWQNLIGHFNAQVQ